VDGFTALVDDGTTTGPVADGAGWRPFGPVTIGNGVAGAPFEATPVTGAPSPLIPSSAMLLRTN